MTYTQLLDYFEPRPIECDEQYWATQEVIAALLAKPTLSAAEQSYLHLRVAVIYVFINSRFALAQKVANRRGHRHWLCNPLLPPAKG